MSDPTTTWRDLAEANLGIAREAIRQRDAALPQTCPDLAGRDLHKPDSSTHPADTCEGSKMPREAQRWETLPEWQRRLTVRNSTGNERLAGKPSLDPELARLLAEHVVTDPDTGAQKGQKLARFDLLPAGALVQVAEVYGHGAEKYEDRNWERGHAWSLSFAAMQRHAWAFWGGEDIDPHSGHPHLASVAFHALSLLTFARTHPEKDDRP